jgi:hypothetical protein
VLQHRSLSIRTRPCTWVWHIHILRPSMYTALALTVMISTLEHVEAAASLLRTQGHGGMQVGIASHRRYRRPHTTVATPHARQPRHRRPVPRRPGSLWATNFSPLTINYLWHLNSPPTFTCRRVTRSCNQYSLPVSTSGLADCNGALSWTKALGMLLPDDGL